MICPAGLPFIAYATGTLLGWHRAEWRDGFLLVLVLSVPAGFAGFLALRRRTVNSVPLLLGLLLLAAFRTSARVRPEFPPDHLVYHTNGEPVRIEGVLCSQPAVHAAFTRLTLDARCKHSSEGPVRVQGRVDLWVPGKTEGLGAGDILLAEARLRIPRPLGNPGESDRKAHAFLEGVQVRGSVSDVNHLLRLGVAEGYRLERFIQPVRVRLTRFFDKEADPEIRGLLRAWFLGDRSGLSEKVTAAFRASGLAHLIAISGLQVGLVGLFVHQTLKCLLKRSSWFLLRFSAEKASVLSCLPVVLVYVLLVGSPVTVVRAAAMFVVFLGSLLLDRARAAWNALALAGLLILVWDPAALFSASFLLSFVAVAGLLAAASLWEAPRVGALAPQAGTGAVLWSRARTWAWKLFTASLGATLATAPLTAYLFNRVTPWAVLVNLVVVPVFGWLVMPMGLMAVLTALVSVTAAEALLAVASAATRFIWMTAEISARFPGANLWVGRPTLLEMLVCYLLLSAWVWLRGSSWRKPVVLACSVTLCVSVALGTFQGRVDPHLVITFLSVGQGESIVVEFPKGKRMIVDGGVAREGYYDAGKSVVLPFLGYRRTRRLHYLVASQGQADHYGGLRWIAEGLKPDELWIGPEVGCEAEGYLSLLDFCRKEGIRVRRLCRPSEVFSIHGVEVQVLNPSCDRTGAEQGSTNCSKRINDRSLVIRLSFGSVDVLLTGDIEEKAEQALRVGGRDTVRAFLLKVPHHGSLTSSSETFLDAVGPRVAVVSAGAGNRFGFPLEKVVRRYRERGILLYRTDLDGAVRFTTDGRSAWVETFGGQRSSAFSPADPCAAGIGGPP